jgi:PAS domain-containing protein
MQALNRTGVPAAMPPVRNNNHIHAFPMRPDVTPKPQSLLGSLLIDIRGTIVFCDTAVARLQGSSCENLIGRPIRAVVPGLPLDPRTEGYNVAFVSFSAARCVRPWPLLKQDGSRTLVEGKVILLNTDESYLFRLELHQPAGGDAASNDRRDLPSATILPLVPAKDIAPVMQD